MQIQLGSMVKFLIIEHLLASINVLRYQQLIIRNRSFLGRKFPAFALFENNSLRLRSGPASVGKDLKFDKEVPAFHSLLEPFLKVLCNPFQ